MYRVRSKVRLAQHPVSCCKADTQGRVSEQSSQATILPYTVPASLWLIFAALKLPFVCKSP